MNKGSEKPVLARGEPEASLPGKQWWRQDSTRLARLALVVGLIVAGLLFLTWRPASPVPQASTATCSISFQPGVAPASSSIHTIKQAYNCLLDNYAGTLDPRDLLRHAMIGIVNYLLQHQQDQPAAVLPRLSDDRQADWQAFERTYTAITAHRSLSRPQLVAAAIAEMVNSLHDDHAHYLPASLNATNGTESSQAGTQTGLGIHLSFSPNQFAPASPPLFIRGIDPGSPAEQAGLRPGDSIVTINGFPPFIGQELVPQVVNPLLNSEPVQLQIQHPGAPGAISIHLVPAAYPAAPLVSTRMLPGNILYVQLTRFERGAADQISSAVQQAGTHLKGLILDLRGNGGGDTEEQRRIISLFVHNQVIGTLVDRQGQRTEIRTDDSVSMLHVHLVALIDRDCASACDVTAMDIRDLHLGRLVGERTAGAASGPTRGFFLDDGSVVAMPQAFLQGPAGEIVDGIGVPPDEEVSPTPADLAAGHDPVREKALQDL
ncbi:MAG TPA: S41 family peptidase [Ktedonobacteraceae bacterium]|nr:S41 family peptidase [Ktedonobacteraceae bacterium]